jgi:hypothetical protein
VKVPSLDVGRPYAGRVEPLSVDRARTEMADPGPLAQIAAKLKESLKT